MRSVVAVVTAAFVLAAAPAAAQKVTSLDDVDFAKLMGKPLRIVDEHGIERHGKLRAASDGQLRLLVPAGEVIVRFAEVRSLDRRDSVGEGLLIGVLWPPIAFALGAGQGFDSEREAWVALPLQMALLGAIGAGIDALNKGWTNVYRAERRSRSGLGILPMRRGVRVAYTRRF